MLTSDPETRITSTQLFEELVRSQKELITYEAPEDDVSEVLDRLEQVDARLTGLFRLVRANRIREGLFEGEFVIYDRHLQKELAESCFIRIEQRLDREAISGFLENHYKH